MRVIKMYCDRCGKEFEKWNYKHIELIGIAEFVYDDNDPYLDTQKDLCESCYTELEKWWNFEPQGSGDSEKINCKTTKCENCKNHNYCDYEPQESEDKR